MQTFVVKVQLSTATGNEKQILAYNRDKSIMWQGPAPKPIEDLMGGRDRGFYTAVLSQDGKILLDKSAPWQSW